MATISQIPKSDRDRGMELESFIRYELPQILCLNGSKTDGIEEMFYGFADNVRALAECKEFTPFLDEFERRMRKIAKHKRSSKQL